MSALLYPTEEFLLRELRIWNIFPIPLLCPCHLAWLSSAFDIAMISRLGSHPASPDKRRQLPLGLSGTVKAEAKDWLSLE